MLEDGDEDCNDISTSLQLPWSIITLRNIPTLTTEERKRISTATSRKFSIKVNFKTFLKIVH